MKNIFFLLLIFSPPIYSRSFSPGELSSLAEERAPLIKMQLEERSAARSQVSQSKLFGNPILTIQSGTLKAGTQSGSVVDLTLGQPIPWPGKRYAEINSAKILEKISEADLEESRLLVHHSVSLLSLELAVLNELEKHNQERKRRFSIIHRFLTSRPMASPQQMVEKNLIENQINLVESQMFDLETKKQSLSQQLEQLSGEVAPTIIVEWKGLPSPQPKTLFLTELENGPRFQKLRRWEELALNRVEQAKFIAKPDIVVGVNYRQENVSPVNHFLHANIAIVIPILDRGQHSIDTAKANARKEEANKKLALFEAETSLNLNYQALLSAHKTTELFKISQIKKNDRQFQTAEEAFKKGRIDATTFLQTDTQIHESIDLAFMSFIKYYSALSQIKMLTGQKLEI